MMPIPNWLDSGTLRRRGKHRLLQSQELMPTPFDDCVPTTRRWLYAGEPYDLYLDEKQ